MRNKRKPMAKAVPVKIDRVLQRRITKVSKKMGEPESTVMRLAMRIGLHPLENLEQLAIEDLRRRLEGMGGDPNAEAV